MKNWLSQSKRLLNYLKEQTLYKLKVKIYSVNDPTVGLRWVPTGKILASCTSKDESEPTHGSNVDIPNIHECKQTLDVSAGTSINVQKEQSLDLSAEFPTADMIELESLFGPLFDEYFNGENHVVLKNSTVTTTDASDKRQKQPDSTSSTSTLARTVIADGNSDL
ncbi:hypothetical protein Tco_1406407 [Tanacetum coccineum]